MVELEIEHKKVEDNVLMIEVFLHNNKDENIDINKRRPFIDIEVFDEDNEKVSVSPFGYIDKPSSIVLGPDDRTIGHGVEMLSKEFLENLALDMRDVDFENSDLVENFSKLKVVAELEEPINGEDVKTEKTFEL